jgi:hypothetical protein
LLLDIKGEGKQNKLEGEEKAAKKVNKKKKLLMRRRSLMHRFI